MNERIKELRKSLGLSQTEFGARIGIKQTSVAGYETGARVPLDAIISAICREFRVEERWLRTGEGEMFVQSTRAQLLADFMADVMTDTEDSARLALVSLLADLDVEDWEAINRIFKKHFQK